MSRKGAGNKYYTTVVANIREYRLPTILTPTFMIGEVIMEMVIPLLMASIIDNGVNKGDMNHILQVGGLMFIAAAAGLLFGLGGAYCGARASTGLAKNLRRAEFEHIQRFSFANIDHFGVSSLITRMTTDVAKGAFTGRAAVNTPTVSPSRSTGTMAQAQRRPSTFI